MRTARSAKGAVKHLSDESTPILRGSESGVFRQARHNDDSLSELTSKQLGPKCRGWTEERGGGDSNWSSAVNRFTM